MAMFLLFLKRYRLPIPLTEYWFHGFRVDAIYPAHRLIIELDSWEFHSNPASVRTRSHAATRSRSGIGTTR